MFGANWSENALLAMAHKGLFSVGVRYDLVRNHPLVIEGICAGKCEPHHTWDDGGASYYELFADRSWWEGVKDEIVRAYREALERERQEERERKRRAKRWVEFPLFIKTTRLNRINRWRYAEEDIGYELIVRLDGNFKIKLFDRKTNKAISLSRHRQVAFLKCQHGAEWRQGLGMGEYYKSPRHFVWDIEKACPQCADKIKEVLND